MFKAFSILSRQDAGKMLVEQRWIEDVPKDTWVIYHDEVFIVGDPRGIMRSKKVSIWRPLDNSYRIWLHPHTLVTPLGPATEIPHDENR